MEYIWYIIASVGAGVGTGLAGLSAATVMVPILIVLCPSFATETGAYQATAIALASDILGSAVTTLTYIRHKNINMKKGWLMMACIIFMCSVGSYAAWKAGNVVLGTFSLFLTFCIGIRFLIKPDAGEKNILQHQSNLDWKEILISLFFGLTIGFGTGFVGTGGGMMMLVVFTLFLGMDHKTAVGTSTLIMTFTALIASISHILIHPAIVMERWDVLLICMFAATVSSLYSARFANRVSNKTVGIATGIVLTVLGASMIFLHYHEWLMSSPLFTDILHGMKIYLIFVLTFASALILAFFLLSIPKALFRKMLHTIAFTSSVVIIYNTVYWQSAVIILISFAVIVYPLLKAAESWSYYSTVFVEKAPGEIRNSLLLLFLSQAFIVFLAWGICNKPWIAVTATLTWGVSDAAAALVGKKFGKTVIPWKISDGKKTWAGTNADVLTSFVTAFLCLYFLTSFSLIRIIVYSFLMAVLSAMVELVSKKGMDTITVPLSLTVLLTGLMLL